MSPARNTHLAAASNLQFKHINQQHQHPNVLSNMKLLF